MILHPATFFFFCFGLLLLLINLAHISWPGRVQRVYCFALPAQDKTVCYLPSIKQQTEKVEDAKETDKTDLKKSEYWIHSSLTPNECYCRVVSAGCGTCAYLKSDLSVKSPDSSFPLAGKV